MRGKPFCRKESIFNTKKPTWHKVFTFVSLWCGQKGHPCITIPHTRHIALHIYGSKYLSCFPTAKYTHPLKRPCLQSFSRPQMLQTENSKMWLFFGKLLWKKECSNCSIPVGGQLLVSCTKPLYHLYCYHINPSPFCSVLLHGIIDFFSILQLFSGCTLKNKLLGYDLFYTLLGLETNYGKVHYLTQK